MLFRKMKLHNLLSEPLILLDRPVKTKAEAIQLLLKTVQARYPFPLKPDDLLRAVMDREALGGTSFPTGIAVPHARIDFLDDIVVAALRPSTPIEDPVAPIRLVVLMLTSQNKPAIYLNSLSSILKFSQKTEAYEKALATHSAKEFLDLIAAQDYNLVKVVTVEDLLTEQPTTVKPDDTLAVLIDLFHHRNISYAPVVDDEGFLVGEVALGDVLKAGFPDFTSQVGNLKFLKTFEPFETLLKKEDRLTVRDLMKPVAFGCDPSASVVELAFEFLQKGRRHCPVVKGRQLVGVLSIMDILNKVIRG
jgi:PTS system nitrogen regulatory IIA component